MLNPLWPNGRTSPVKPLHGFVEEITFPTATIHYVLLRQEEFIAVENQIGMRFSDWATWPMNLIAVKVKDWVLSQRINAIAQAMREGA